MAAFKLRKGNSLDVLVGIPHVWRVRTSLSSVECKHCRKMIITRGFHCDVCEFPAHKKCMLKTDVRSCANIPAHQLESRTFLASYLEKKPPKIKSKSRSAISHASWQKRWFVLTKDCNLFYYKSHKVIISKLFSMSPFTPNNRGKITITLEWIHQWSCLFD